MTFTTNQANQSSPQESSPSITLMVGSHSPPRMFLHLLLRSTTETYSFRGWEFWVQMVILLLISAKACDKPFWTASNQAKSALLLTNLRILYSFSAKARECAARRKKYPRRGLSTLRNSRRWEKSVTSSTRVTRNHQRSPLLTFLIKDWSNHRLIVSTVWSMLEASLKRQSGIKLLTFLCWIRINLRVNREHLLLMHRAQADLAPKNSF